MRAFRFEIGASVGFLVHAESTVNACQKAQKVCEMLFKQDFILDLPVGFNAYLAVDEASPELVDEVTLDGKAVKAEPDLNESISAHRIVIWKEPAHP